MKVITAAVVACLLAGCSSVPPANGRSPASGHTFGKHDAEVWHQGT